MSAIDSFMPVRDRLARVNESMASVTGHRHPTHSSQKKACMGHPGFNELERRSVMVRRNNRKGRAGRAFSGPESRLRGRESFLLSSIIRVPS